MGSREPLPAATVAKALRTRKLRRVSGWIGIGVRENNIVGGLRELLIVGAEETEAVCDFVFCGV